MRWIRPLYANRQVIVSSMQLAGGVNIQRDPHALAPAVYSCLHPLHACLFSKNPTIVGESAKTIEALVALLPAEVVNRVITTSIEPENPRQPNVFLMGIVNMNSNSTSASKEAIARMVTKICAGGGHLKDFILRLLTQPRT